MAGEGKVPKLYATRTMTAYFPPTVISDTSISDTSRRSFLLRGGAFMAVAAMSSGAIPAQALTAPFPALFNSREKLVMPSSAVAANMAALNISPRRFLGPGETRVAGLLRTVQEYVNGCRYQPGAWSETFTTPWRPPRALFHGEGDCRDFAVAKYILLRRFGLAHHDLRLILLDLPPTRRPRPERRTQTVLAVNLGGKVGILDNFHGHVLPHKQMLGCCPLWSLNRYGLWRHLG